VSGNEQNPPEEKICSCPFFWPGLAIVALVFAVAAFLTWRRWPDLVIDFGLQLYIPWRLEHGATLYRDLFYLAGGPLSQYYHAALFACFGASFQTIIVSNLLITGAMLVLIYHQFARVCGTPAATIIASAVTIVFAFAQYNGIGNNNYAAPYSHEMLHGLALSVFAVALLARWLETNKIRTLGAAGFVFGLVLFTKPDIAIALAAAVVTAFVIVHRTRKEIVKKSAVVFFSTATLPVIGFFLLFFRTQSAGESLRLEFFGWGPALAGGVVKNPFYQWSLGLDYPFEHIRQSAIHFLVAAGIVAVTAYVFRATEKFPAYARWLWNAGAMLVLWLAAMQFDWLNCGASLPLLCLVAVFLLIKEFNRGERSHKIIFPLLWSVFALLLLAKQGLFPRIWHTGFALAMPAFVCAMYLFLRLLPEFLEVRWQVPLRLLKFAALGVLAIACFRLAEVSAKFYSDKTLAVGHGGDVIYARGEEAHSVEGENFNRALDWMQKHVPAGATFAALPQGLMLNYLSRHVNPAPCLDWNPTMLEYFGAHSMTAALTNHPPDYLALVEWQTFEFGTGYFGSAGYGDDVMAWVNANYEPAALFGSEPLRNGLFGIKILKHRVPVPSVKKIETVAPAR
jgi:hypothetical protein